MLRQTQLQGCKYRGSDVNISDKQDAYHSTCLFIVLRCDVFGWQPRKERNWRCLQQFWQLRFVILDLSDLYFFLFLDEITLLCALPELKTIVDRFDIKKLEREFSKITEVSNCFVGDNGQISRYIFIYLLNWGGKIYQTREHTYLVNWRNFFYKLCIIDYWLRNSVRFWTAVTQ